MPHLLRITFISMVLLFTQACSKPDSMNISEKKSNRIHASSKKVSILRKKKRNFFSLDQKAMKGDIKPLFFDDIGSVDVGSSIIVGGAMGWSASTTMTIYSVNVTGSAFTSVGGCGPGVYPGPMECDYDVEFKPTAVGDYNGTLTVSYETGGFPAVYQIDFFGKGQKRPTKNNVPKVCGSIISPSDRSVVEEIPLVGVPFTLQYNSRLAPEYVTDEGTLDPSYGYNQEAWIPSIHKYYDFMTRRLFSGTSVQSLDYKLNDDEDEATVVSPDGAEVYVFNEYGQHIYTNSFRTGALIYQFNYSSDLLSSIEDAYGNTTTFTRDSDDYIIKITAPYGQETNLTVNGDGYFKTVSNPKGEIYTLAYKSGTALLRSFKKPGGQITTLTYDADGKLIKDLGHGGNFTQFSVDTSGNIVATSQMGRSTVYSSGYNSSGLSSNQVTDPSLLVTQYSEDSNEAAATTNAIESSSSTKVNDERFGAIFKRPSASTYTIGGVTATTNVTQTYDPGSGTGFFDYASLTNVINEDGVERTEVWNNVTKVLTSTSTEGVQTKMSYDGNERLTQFKHGSLTPITFTYDTNGRLAQQIQGTANQLSYTYNTGGYLSKITNGRSEETSYVYDLAARLTNKILPDTRTIQYQYDSNGNLTGITPPGRPMHIFGYNAMELNSSYKSPVVSGSTTYSYNLDKQMTTISRPSGKIATFSYDATKGLLNQVAVAAGNYSYAYSSVVPGQIDFIQSPYGVKNKFTYRGPIVSAEEQIRSSDSASMGKVSFGFDSAHRVISRTIQDSASTSSTVNYTLNDDGQPIYVGDMKMTYTRSTGALLTAKTGKISDSWAYDSYGNVAGFASIYVPSSGPTSVLYMYTLTRDNMSRITQMSETIGGVTTNYEYQYDSAGRLTQVKKNSAVTATFTYDSNSNRTSQTIDGVTTAAVFDNEDRMTSFGSKTYTYDDNGDLTQSTNSLSISSYYNYDVFGNLTQATPNSGVTYDYLIDGQNRLVGKSIAGTLNRRYLYESQLKVTAQLSASGILQKEFVYATGNHMPDYMVTATGKYRILTNHLGSPRVVVDITNGTIMQRMDYNINGSVTADTNPDFQPFGFAGGLYDAHTGLVRFGARDYDSETGRWTTKDPIGFNGGDTNLYGYVMNDPVNFVDSTGLARGDWWDLRTYVMPVVEAVQGATDFARNYSNMRTANTIGADKYFHCMANCQSTQRGPGGYGAAVGISEGREYFDQYIKGDSENACNADRTANAQGRSGAGGGACSQVCGSLRPNGLRSKW